MAMQKRIGEMIPAATKKGFYSGLNDCFAADPLEQYLKFQVHTLGIWRVLNRLYLQ